MHRLPGSPRARPRPPSTSPTAWRRTPTCWNGSGRTPRGSVCIYMKDLTAVDLEILEAIVARSYATVTAGTYVQRAREGGTS